MGTRYYGKDRGEQQKDISIDTSTTSKKMELAIDDASNLSKDDVVKFLKECEAEVMEDTGFPGA